MSPDVQKLAMAGAIAAAAWLGAAAPLWRSSGARDERVLSWGNALAAGILLGIGLIHMLAESATAFAKLGFLYPAPYALAAAAFLALLLLEHVVLPEAAHQAVHARSGEAHHALPSDPSKALTPYALIGALSVHSVLAGITLGAQSGFASGLALFAGLLTHKTMEGFALGVSLARSGITRARALGILGVFALLTPTGIGLGTGLSDLMDVPGTRLFEAASLALAGGTFLYIASLDLMRDEYLRPGSAWQKWLFTALGVLLAALLGA